MPLSPEVVALLVLLAGAVAAVAFTLAVVAMVDRSAGGPNEDDGAREREEENHR